MPTGPVQQLRAGFHLTIRHDGTRDVAPRGAQHVFLDVALPTKAAPALRLPHPSASDHPATGPDMTSERASDERHEGPPAVHANITFQTRRPLGRWSKLQVGSGPGHTASLHTMHFGKQVEHHRPHLEKRIKPQVRAPLQ